MIKAADQWNTWNATREDDVRITSIIGVNHVRVLNENRIVKNKSDRFSKMEDMSFMSSDDNIR